MEFEISEIRKFTKISAPMADFDEHYTFYYDETNNIRKFYVRETDFNYSFTANFVLGGLVHAGNPPAVQELIDSLQLQSSIKEIKLKHLGKGEFLNCIRSKKLTLFFDFLLKNDFYVHYSSLNILYWSIVDIVDSAIANSEVSQQLGPQFAFKLKNDLYKLCRLEIDSLIELFYNYEYPNIKKEFKIPFIEDLTSLFNEYLDDPEFHFGLESLRQILKEAKKKGLLPFVMDEEDFILLKDLSQFYLRPIYLFKNSKHVFDNEYSISEEIGKFKILDGSDEIKNYSFVDSQSNQFIQLSDVFVGIYGKLTQYVNTKSTNEIISDLDNMDEQQLKNIDLLIDLIDKSDAKNTGFLHAIDSFEELSKMNVIRTKRNKNHA